MAMSRFPRIFSSDRSRISFGRLRVGFPSSYDDHSVVRLSLGKMNDLELCEGDTVFMKSKKNHTFGISKCDNHIRDGCIIIHGDSRKNLKVRVGDIVSVQGCHLVDGKDIRVLPIEEPLEGIPRKLNLYLKQYFSDAHRPVCEGDRFVIHGVEFKVVETNPSPYCIVAPDTAIHSDGEAVQRGKDEVSLNEIGYDDIGGSSQLLAQLIEKVALPLCHPQIFKALGVKHPRGVIIYGQSGVGKTLLVTALANETGVFIFKITGPELMSEFAGDPESKLSKAFEEAVKHAPAIIIIDEIEWIAPKTEGFARMVTNLSALMNGLKSSVPVTVMATTSQPVHSDLCQVGLFEIQVKLEMPDYNARVQILRIQTKNMKLYGAGLLEKVANETQGLVSGDIAAMCSVAKVQPIRKNLPRCYLEDGQIDDEMIESLYVTMDHFMWALSKSDPAGVRERGCEAVG